MLELSRLKHRFSDKSLDLFVTVFMLFMMAAMLYPFVYTISLSLSRSSAVLAGKVKLFPIGFNTNAYYHVLREPRILRGFAMSVFYVVTGTAALLFLASLMAYPLSLRVFYPRRVILIFVLFTMLFNEGIIPRFLWIKTLGLLDTVWAIVLPSALTAWYLIIFRTFLQQHPESLRESALIDGANDFTILFRIVLPLSKPILATLTIFHMVFHWNSFFPALLYLSSSHLMPVQIILRRVLVSATTYLQMFIGEEEEVLALPMSVQAAFIVVIVFPIIVVYPFAQKYFTKGVMIGAIKG